MANESIIKSLSRETKALILVSEFEARRMPMFQMRAILNEIVANEEEKKLIIDLVENDLKATGYHPNQINSFLQDILNEQQAAAEANMRVTRRLRSPFARGFEDAKPAEVGSGVHQQPQVAQGQPPAPQPVASTPALPTGGKTIPIPKPFSHGARASKTAAPVDLPKPKVPVGPLPTPPPVDDDKPPPPREHSGQAYFGNAPVGVQAAQIQEKPRVLLADDDKRIRIVFRMCLERLGTQVVEANDGNEAWKLIQKGNLSLVVLDMKMPGLHGLEVVTRMTTQQVDLPIIICSAYDQLKEEFVIATHPRLRYLVKPVAAEALEAAVQELLGMPKT